MIGNVRLFQQGEITLDVKVQSIRRRHSLGKNLRLTQSPGGSQSFVLGRNVARASPIAIRVIVEANSEKNARAKLAEITAFARDAVMLGQVHNRRLAVDSLERLLGNGKSLRRGNPEPLHQGATDWSFLLELRPQYPVYTTESDGRTIDTGAHRTTNSGNRRITFNAA